MLESLFNKVEEQTPRQVFSCEYSESFENSFLYRTPSGGCFCQFDKVTSVLGICELSLINQKQKNKTKTKKQTNKKQCGMVSTEKVCRSAQSIFFKHWQKPLRQVFSD